MTDQPIGLRTEGPPETILPPAPADMAAALQAALSANDRRTALAEVVGKWPRSVEAWAHLAAATPEGLEAYAYARVGYHRGLDSLRGAGWRGSGFVRWSHDSNRGLLRAFAELARQAAVIGETDEVDRMRQFLLQLDPAWSDANLDAS